MADHFPKEIWLEILHRLPLNSIGRCTSVCKSWYSLITSPSFISHHLHHSPSPQFLLLPIHDDTGHTIRYNLIYDDPRLYDPSSTLDLHFPPSFDDDYSVVSITHGLMLCLNTSSRLQEYFICNPYLRRFLPLPKPRDLPYPHIMYASTVFLSDSRNQDYKVVRIVRVSGDKDFRPPALQVDLYSIASGVWKDVTAYAPECCSLYTVRGEAPHGYVNGVVHWGVKRMIGNGFYSFVLSFRSEDEVFGEVLLPRCMGSDPYDCVTVLGGGKDLTIYHSSQDHNWDWHGDIWVMKEYGVVESWNKVFSLDREWEKICLESPWLDEMINFPRALGVRSSGEVLFVLDLDEDEDNEPICLLDVERKTFRDLGIGMDENTEQVICCLLAGYYKESLILLNKARGLLTY